MPINHWLLHTNNRCNSLYVCAYILVHCRAVAIALVSFAFQAAATSLANGSSGFGADNRPCTVSSTVRIVRAGVHLSFSVSRQMRPINSSEYAYTVDSVSRNTDKGISVNEYKV